MKKLYLFFLVITLITNNLFSQEKWEPLNGPHPQRYGLDYAYDDSKGGLFTITPYFELNKSTDFGLSWSELSIVELNSYAPGTRADIVTTMDNIFVLCATNIDNDNFLSHLYKSTDKGGSWTKASTFSSHSYRIATDNNGSIFAVTKEKNQYDQGIYVSTDQGMSFTLSTKGIDGGVINKDMLLSDQKGEVYISTTDSGGVTPVSYFSSKDHGKSWQKISFPDSISKPDDFLVSSSGVVYIKGNSKMAYSLDGGKSWSEPMDARNLWYLSMANGRIYKNNIYSLINDSIYRSTDNGRTWSDFGVGKDRRLMTVSQFNDSFIMAKTGSGIFTSTDNGQNWKKISYDYNKKMITSCIYARNNDVLLVGEGCAYSTDNGDTWSDMPLFSLDKCYISSDGTFYITYVGPPDEYITNLVYSTDKGASWHGTEFHPINDICENGKGEIFVPVETGLIKGSKATWEYINLPFDMQSTYNSGSAAVAVSKSDDIYIMCNLGLLKYNHSTGSIDVVALLSALPIEEKLRFSIAINSNDEIFISNGPKVFSSIDQGLNWNELYSGKILNSVKDIIINKSDEITLRLITDILVSKDDGKTWTSTGEGLSKGGINAFSQSENGYAYCGYYGGRIYRRNIFTSVEDKALIDNNAFAYPNPARDRVTISLPDIFSGREVNVEVYDMTGKAVYKNISQISEDNIIQLDISTFESGIYYAVIKGRTNTIAEKFSVVK